MAAPVIGAGYLRVVDRLMDASYALFEPVVNQKFPTTVTAGQQTIQISDPSIYVNCQLVCGVTGANLEVVTVTAVTSNSFIATFANSHQAGEAIVGATFPVRYPTDQLFTQAEMTAYISSAVSDFLTDCPLAYAIASVSVAPTEQSTALPGDCLWPARVAYNNYPLRETSQANLDANDYQWNQHGLNEPRSYYRDKIPVQNVGIWPRMGNKVNLEVVYAQRQAQMMGWGDGFLVPDCLTQYILYKTLSYAYSKDGEARNPGLAKYFASRYEFGVKVCKMLLEVINDPNLQLAG